MEFLIEEIDDLPINDDPVTSEEVRVDIIINNVTCSCQIGCKVDFNKIPQRYMSSPHIATFRTNGCVMALRSSGKLHVMKTPTEEQAKLAAKKNIKVLRLWGLDATFNDFKVHKYFCSCLLPWAIETKKIVTKYSNDFMYEPRHKSCVLKINRSHGFLSAYCSGSVQIIGCSLERVISVLEQALPFFSEFRTVKYDNTNSNS